MRINRKTQTGFRSINQPVSEGGQGFSNRETGNFLSRDTGSQAPIDFGGLCLFVQQVGMNSMRLVTFESGDGMPHPHTYSNVTATAGPSQVVGPGPLQPVLLGFALVTSRRSPMGASAPQRPNERKKRVFHEMSALIIGGWHKFKKDKLLSNVQRVVQ